jgi:hypothetical protein
MIEKKGVTKSGDELWLFIDPESEPSCTLVLWCLGETIDFSVETAEEALALYEAMLTISSITSD